MSGTEPGSPPASGPAKAGPAKAGPAKAGPLGGAAAEAGPAGAAAAGQPARRTVLALGSNLGDRLATLQGGVDALLGPSGLDPSGLDSSGLTLVALSPVYETVPVGGPPQPEYLNAVLIAETTLPPAELLRRGQAVEAAFGRVRQEVWGPRTLDVDVIVYGDVVSDDPELTLPHPRAQERAFVLAPWLDADPDAEIPGQGRVAELLDAAVARNGGQPGVRRLAGVQLRPPA
jgi:2-amino-4-hydroxy-6-hydroxymethyldihydropteridine diphosphokinase